MKKTPLVVMTMRNWKSGEWQGILLNSSIFHGKRSLTLVVLYILIGRSAVVRMLT